VVVPCPWPRGKACSAVAHRPRIVTVCCPRSCEPSNEARHFQPTIGLYVSNLLHQCWSVVSAAHVMLLYGVARVHVMPLHRVPLD
jgi:hypothetical protein